MVHLACSRYTAIRFYFFFFFDVLTCVNTGLETELGVNTGSRLCVCSCVSTTQGYKDKKLGAGVGVGIWVEKGTWIRV